MQLNNVIRQTWERRIAETPWLISISLARILACSTMGTSTYCPETGSAWLDLHFGGSYSLAAFLLFSSLSASSGRRVKKEDSLLGYGVAIVDDVVLGECAPISTQTIT